MVVMRDFLRAMFRLIKKDMRRFPLWGVLRPRLIRDIWKFRDDLDRFILVAFNRESDRSRGKARVTLAGSEELAQAVVLQVFGEVKKVNLQAIMGLKVFPYGKELYSFNLEMNGKIPDRARRSLIGQSIEAGFDGMDVDKIARIAKHWYESRVVHAGPQEYCLYLTKTQEETLV